MTRIDLIIIAGDTFPARLTVKKAGITADLTGCTLSLIAKRDGMVLDADSDLELVDGDGLTIDPLTGLVDLVISAARAALLSTAFPYIWDLQVIEASGNAFKICGGELVVQTDISAPLAMTSTAAAGSLSSYTAAISVTPAITGGGLTDEGGGTLVDEGGGAIAGEGS